MSGLVKVAVAVIFNKKNEVLISLRPDNVHLAGMWEFPGGKLEEGESVFDALKRELYEELNIEINSASKIKQVHYQYPDKTVLLDIMRVESFSGEPIGAEGQKIKWQAVRELNINDFPQANRSIINLLKLPDRYMITGSFESQPAFSSKLESSLKEGIRLVQLRCKKSTDTEFKQLIKVAVNLCEQYSATLLINNSAEIFADSHADGLHLSSKMLGLLQSRPIADEFILSVSCHSEDEIEKANKLNADIILLSPVKATQSHPGVEGIGWEKFAEISSGTNAPVYALGGMSEADLCDAKKSGAHGVAAISSFWG